METRDLETGNLKAWHPDGVVVFIGLVPNAAFCPEEIERNAAGFIVTDNALQTSMEGDLAARDVRGGATAQAASAAWEGAAVALMMRDYLQSVG